MNSTENVTPIVVAVDGSDSAHQAARWAATQAARRGRRLRFVHAYEFPLEYDAVLVDRMTLHDAVRRTATDVVQKAMATIEPASPDLPIESATLHGPAAATLRDASRDASLLVLGSRGLGGFTGLLAGSVTVALAAHGHCPVAIIRGEEAAPEAPVVVGVDGSTASEAAVALAFDEAATRGCGLVAVHTWTDTVFPVTPNGAYYPELDWTKLTERATKLLAERIAGWQEKFPDVTVRQVVEHDRPARVLLREAQGAQLIVVGSRGRGGFAGLVLGSVSQAMIHHSPCPVIVARPESGN